MHWADSNRILDLVVFGNNIICEFASILVSIWRWERRLADFVWFSVMFLRFFCLFSISFAIFFFNFWHLTKIGRKAFCLLVTVTYLSYLSSLHFPLNISRFFLFIDSAYFIRLPKRINKIGKVVRTEKMRSTLQTTKPINIYCIPRNTSIRRTFAWCSIQFETDQML